MLALKNDLACTNYEAIQNSSHQKEFDKAALLSKLQWDLSDRTCEVLKTENTKDMRGKINFELIANKDVQKHLMEFAYYSTTNNHLSLGTVAYYLRKGNLKIFNLFIKENNLMKTTYRDLLSASNLFELYKEHLRKYNKKTDDVRNHCFLVQIPRYLFEIDIKNNPTLSTNKDDILDIRTIPGARYSRHISNYTLNFSSISDKSLKEIIRKYIKIMLVNKCFSTCQNHLSYLVFFEKYLHTSKILFSDTVRSDIEQYVIHLDKHKKPKWRYIGGLYSFLEYCQINNLEMAPCVNVNMLIFKTDRGRKEQSKQNYKHIEEDVLEQLENHIQDITPKEYIPVVILLRASGWRISDVLNLRYDNCLDNTSNGYFLCGDIQKTEVLEHRIPISDEIAKIVKASISIAKDVKNNKDKYLFVTTSGKREGYPYNGKNVGLSLNRLAKKHNIADKNGDIFRFKSHAFRHTKAVELINNGMNLIHVQKWLAHLTPIMTLHYAKLLDQTMRKSWEEATKDGLFKLDGTGNASKVDISNIQDEDIIEWEWIKHNLDAVRMPLGYCMKPNKMECATQLNPCLTCRSLCTTPEFIPAFEQEILQTKEIINKGKSQNRTFWVEKNEVLLNKLESVLSVIKDGKIKHDAGKQGREYVGEQRK